MSAQGTERMAPLRAAVADHGAAVVLALALATLTVFLGFRSGGFFIGPPALVTMGLLMLLAGRVLVVALPGEGLSRPLALAMGGLGLFAVWTLLSGRWSHAPARALVEFDRVLLYTTALVLFGLVAMRPRHLRWMLWGVLAAITVLCGVALATRLLPDVWPIAHQPDENTRLNYPVSYWNTLGALAAVGITICFGLTSSERESRTVRVLAAAGLPALGAVLVLTLSRGGLATAVVGLVVFVVVGHTRGMLTGALATVPTTAIAVASGYGAELLVSANPLSAAAQAQGHDVALVVALCAAGAGTLRALLLYADARLAALQPSATHRRQVLGVGAVALAIIATGAAIAVDVPEQYRAFTQSAAARSAETSREELLDPRRRLSTAANNGRLGHWRVAIGEFERHPLRGTGAGTFANSWDVHRRTTVNVTDAHSLYAEVLGELGLVGLALLLVALIAILVGVLRRARGPNRALFATIFAAITAWVVAAGFDWHWEMPVVTMWVFALGGAAIAATPKPMPPKRFLAIAPRAAIAVACGALVALAPLRLAISELHLNSADIAYAKQDCTEVLRLTGQSLKAVGSRPEPRELRALCALRSGQSARAIRSLRAAARDDPRNWRPQYALAVVQARSGRDPRRAIRAARRLNPRNGAIKRAATAFERAETGTQWRQAALRIRLSSLVPRT